MKKIFLLIILSFITLPIFAQQKTSTIDNEKPKVFNQPELDKFYGTWVYEKNGLYFSVTLEKSIFKRTENSRLELLSGTHVFKQNGKIVDAKDKGDNPNSIDVGTFDNSNKKIVKFIFHEYNRHVGSSGTMEYVDGPTPAIIWKLEPNLRRRGIIFPGQENLKEPEYIVPTNITLYKVK